MRLLYTFSVRCYYLLIVLASPFNRKARQWLCGRKNIFGELARDIKKGEPLVWFHCASLGEFEQGRPIIEKIKKEKPSTRILLTFFSPSGYEVRKDYAGADHIFYLPLDTQRNAKKFLALTDPLAVIFIRYEFWYNYLSAIKKNNIPLYLASGTFRKDHVFFKGRGKWFREQLKNFTHFFVQDESSEKLLKDAGFNNVSISGDTRFDRVATIAAEKKDIPLVEKFVAGHKTLIGGSTWGEEESILASAISSMSGWKIIIAPHLVNEARLSAIENKFRKLNCIRYSRATAENIHSHDLLLIDSIGLLARIYRYGSIAFVGGGFGSGIHSLLEASAFGVPVIFGPNYHKFHEAEGLIRCGGGFSIRNAEEFEKTFAFLAGDPLVARMASLASANYVLSQKGATEKISRHILAALPD